MSKFYLEDYQGKPVAGAVSVAAGEKTRLPDIECKFVQLSRWNATEDGQYTVSGPDYLDTDDEVYYGFGTVLFGQLFISQTTDLIPVSNLNELTILVPSKSAGAATIHYVCFK